MINKVVSHINQPFTTLQFKLKRSERLIDMTNYLINHPRTLITSGFFVKRYSSAKSSISEDLSIMKSTLAKRQLGTIEITNGAAGGIKYIFNSTGCSISNFNGS